MSITVEQIDDLLPQTQCRQCGFNGCADYANAILEGAEINRCPSGGDELIVKLAKYLNHKVIPLDTSHGVHVAPEVARINSKQCIGCTLCIDACPTEAIIGVSKHLHFVDSGRCNGCCLCQIACPMDCIEMVRINREWTKDLADLSRRNFQEKIKRKEKREKQLEARLEKQSNINEKKELIESLKRGANEPTKAHRDIKETPN